jgi:hypothetical protein
MLERLDDESLIELVQLCGRFVGDENIRSQLEALNIPISRPSEMTDADRGLLRALCVATKTPYQQRDRASYRGFEFEDEKNRLEEDLYEYGRAAWHIVEPDQAFIPGRHIEMICRHLQALTDGTLELDNLLINVPPGHSKSIFTNVFWPSWCWTRRPGKRFLYGSYDQKLSTRDSISCRSIIESDWYQSRWPHVKLVSDQNEKRTFQNSARGWRMATSVGGAGTGLHPHFIVCHPAGERIDAVGGERNVESLVAGDSVWSYNHETGSVVRRKVSAVRRRRYQGRLVTIRTGGGRIRVTEDHPVFVVGRGYVPAKEVRSGDVLLRRVREGVSTKPISSGKNEARLLLAEVLRRRQQWGSESQPNSSRNRRSGVRGVRGNANQSEAVLFTQVSIDDEQAYRENLSAVFDSFSGWISKKERDLLFAEMCRRRAFREDLRSSESEVQGRRITGTVQRRVSVSKARDNREGRRSLRDLRGTSGGSCCGSRSGPRSAPYRLRQDERRPDKSDYLMSVVPLGSGRWSGAEGPVPERVVSVESKSFDGDVFNLEVEVDHNYFTDGLLVHNCDDPHDVRRANSEKERQKGLDWWTNTMSSRGILVDVKKVVIMQRLHVDDVSGWILRNQRDQYDHICLPARFEAGMMEPTSLGLTDWRSIEGELLWPQGFSEEKLWKMELPMGQIEAAGQLQQRPMIKGGMLFKREWFVEQTIQQLAGGFTGKYEHFLTGRGLFA